MIGVLCTVGMFCAVSNFWQSHLWLLAISDLAIDFEWSGQPDSRLAVRFAAGITNLLWPFLVLVANSTCCC